MISSGLESSFEIESMISKDFNKKFVNDVKSVLLEFLAKNNENIVAVNAVQSSIKILDYLWDVHHNMR